MQIGDRVRWHVMSVDESDSHSPHWHGHTFLQNQVRTDTLFLPSSSTYSLDMIADNVGVWIVLCHKHSHAGMYALYNVHNETHMMDKHIADATGWKYVLIFSSMFILGVASVIIGHKYL